MYEAKTTSDEDTIRVSAEEYAKKNSWVQNPDKDVLNRVIRGLAKNEQKFGEQYCPCRIRSGDKEKDKANICPCVYHEAEMAKDGHCLCQLFFTKDTAEKNRKT